MGILRKVKKAAKAVGNAVDPAKAVARTVDKAVDTFKDDEFVIEGESALEVFGVRIGRISHRLRAFVADKESPNE